MYAQNQHLEILHNRHILRMHEDVHPLNIWYRCQTTNTTLNPLTYAHNIQTMKWNWIEQVWEVNGIKSTSR